MLYEVITEYKVYNNEEDVQVHPFLNNMDFAYAASDIIISRAGAGSVSELCVVGKPVIFIPSPNVAEDHQTKNALAIVEKEAALMIKDRITSYNVCYTKLLRLSCQMSLVCLQWMPFHC